MKLGHVKVASLRLRNGAQIAAGDSEPTAQERLMPGSLYLVCADGEGALFMNVGSRDDPVWKRMAVTEP